MRILLVDDEEDILEGMLAGIDFAALGFDWVHTAGSAQEAREILEKEPVDILLTDIEMPGESGLELLNWLRQQNSDIVTMFCTSYANFDYAKKAVEMHSFDYYLKPISYDDLRAHLEAAVREVRKKHSESAYRQMGEYWLKGRRENQTGFWTSVLASVSPLAEVTRGGRDKGISYREEDQFTLCYVRVMDKEPQPLEQWKVYGFRNVAEELFHQNGLRLEAAILSKECHWTLVLRQGPEQTSGKFCHVVLALLAQAEELFHVSANGYYRKDLALSATRQAYETLLWADKEDVLRAHPLTDASGYRSPEGSYGPAVMEGWAELLTAGRMEEISAAASSVLGRCVADRTLNVEFLKSMRADLQQMVFSELNQRGINVHTLFNNACYEQLLEGSLDSVERFRAYLEYLFHQTEEQMRFAAQTDTVVGRVKSYVQEHLSEDVNRTNVAKQFFLNPDYLARLFKKETGQTLGSYLQEQRILEAKKLLCQSGLPVSMVAQRVGYDNYSYFSQFFHEKTGMSPSQFRKRFGS